MKAGYTPGNIPTKNLEVKPLAGYEGLMFWNHIQFEKLQVNDRNNLILGFFGTIYAVCW